jgi:hypothetical protein
VRLGAFFVLFRTHINLFVFNNFLDFSNILPDFGLARAQTGILAFIVERARDQFTAF